MSFNICKYGCSAIVAAAVVAGTANAPTPVLADEHSYRGETLKVIIRSSPGGGYDFYGRLIARHISEFLPGNPDTIAQNMPGSGGIVASNYMANRAPADGTEIAILPRDLVLAQRTKATGVRFDVRKLISIGSAASSTWVWTVGPDVPLKTLGDFKTFEDKPVKFSSTGAGAGSYTKVKFLDAVGYPVELITGYDGTAEKVLAVVRGEVHGTSGSWGSMRDAINNEGLKIVAKMGNSPDVAQYEEVRDLLTGDNKALASLMAAPLVAGRPFFTAPGSPDGRVHALRTGFKEAIDDSDLRAEAKKAKRSIGWTSAGEMDEIYRDILNASDKVVDEFKSMM